MQNNLGGAPAKYHHRCARQVLFLINLFSVPYLSQAYDSTPLTHPLILDEPKKVTPRKITKSSSQGDQ